MLSASHLLLPKPESGILIHEMGNETTDLEGTNASMHHLTAGENSAATVRKESPASLQEEPQLKRIKIEAAADPTLAAPASLGAAALPLSVAASGAVKKNAPNNQILLAASGHSKQNLAGEKVGGLIAVKKEAGTSGSSIVTVSPTTNQSASDSDNSSAASLPEDAHKNSEKPRAVQAPPVQAPAAAAAADADEVPLKSTKLSHLRTKYTSELEYMLREFRKLERQLLGAKGASQLEESAGSRERREKLHAFILHLEDTLRQIELGCKLEAEGKSTVNVGVTTNNNNTNAAVDEGKKQQLAEQAALANLTQEKEEEENVQKLEEHILANLLPVKVRLKKQLAAQQGATKNPVGMPASRRGMLQPSATAELGKGTFAAAAEQRRKQAEEARRAAQEQEHAASRVVTDPTQFGKPLSGGGSSLTQKLHGATLGSKARTNGHGVGYSSKLPAAEGLERPERKILYAGMVPQSLQHSSGVAAASGVHEMAIEDPTLRHGSNKAPGRKQEALAASSAVQLSKPIQAAPQQSTAPSKPAVPSEDDDDSDLDKKPDASELTEEEIRKLRKRRRKKKLLRLGRQREKERRRQLALHQQAIQAAQTSSAVVPGRKKGAGGKGQGKKKGPRSVEYICALCSEAYSSTCDYNPWWALAHHECPKCRKNQVPRIDISSPANAIEYHPALLAHADDNGGGNTEETTVVQHASQPQALPAVVFPPNSTITPTKYPALSMSDSDSESDLSDLSDGSLSDYSMDSDDSTLDLQSMSPAEQAEHETFGHDYKGPVFSDENASRLLVLMCHASTCPCKHKLTKTRDVCKSTKYMMLHVRDCPGTTSTFDVCPFPWCRKVKYLLYHLVSCTNPIECTICSPKDLTKSLKGLVGLNEHRFKEKRERLVAAIKAASEAARGNGPGSIHPTVVTSASLTPMPAPTQKAPTKHKIVPTSTHSVPPAPKQHRPTSVAKPVIPQPATVKAPVARAPSSQPATLRVPHPLASATTAAAAQPTQVPTGTATIISQPVKSEAQALPATTPNSASAVPLSAHAAQTAVRAKVVTRPTGVFVSKTEAVAVSASLVASSPDRPQPMDATTTANTAVPNPIPQPSTPPTSNTSQAQEQRLPEVTTGQQTATAMAGAPTQVTAQAPQEAVQVKDVNAATPKNSLDAAAQQTGGATGNASVDSTAMEWVNVSEAREVTGLPSEPTPAENIPTAQEPMAENNATEHVAVMKEELVVMSTVAAPLGVGAMDVEAASESNEVPVPNAPLVNVPTVSLEPAKSDGVVQAMPQPNAQEVASPVKAPGDLPPVGKGPAPIAEVAQTEQAPRSQVKLEALQIDAAASQVSVPLPYATPSVDEKTAPPAVATATIASLVSNPLENCTTPGLDSVAVKQEVHEEVSGEGNPTEQPNTAVIKTTATDDQIPSLPAVSTATENAAAEETVVAPSSDQPQGASQEANPEESQSALQADTTAMRSPPPAIEQVKQEPALAEETVVVPSSDQPHGTSQEANPEEPQSALQAYTTAMRSPPPAVEQITQEPALDEGANPAGEVVSGELQTESEPSTTKATEEDAPNNVKNGSSEHSTSAAGDSGADDKNDNHSLGATSGNGNHHSAGKAEKSADVVEVGC